MSGQGISQKRQTGCEPRKKYDLSSKNSTDIIETFLGQWEVRGKMPSPPPCVRNEYIWAGCISNQHEYLVNSTSNLSLPSKLRVPNCKMEKLNSVFYKVVPGYNLIITQLNFILSLIYWLWIGNFFLWVCISPLLRKPKRYSGKIPTQNHCL